jgi:arylsulfatase A-like enzyme
VTNIVYMNSHDTGRYVQPYGHDVPAPNLQKLAQEGVLFRQAHSAAPTCSLSRASLLTGQCSHSNGMVGLVHLGFSLNDYRRHMLHTLRSEGYYSALSGEQHIARDASVIGYDLVLTRQGAFSGPSTAGPWSFSKTRRNNPSFLRLASMKPTAGFTIQLRVRRHGTACRRICGDFYSASYSSLLLHSHCQDRFGDGGYHD